jgi:hypothetical protein
MGIACTIRYTLKCPCAPANVADPAYKTPRPSTLVWHESSKQLIRIGLMHEWAQRAGKRCNWSSPRLTLRLLPHGTYRSCTGATWSRYASEIGGSECPRWHVPDSLDAFMSAGCPPAWLRSELRGNSSVVAFCRSAWEQSALGSDGAHAKPKG